MTCRRLHGPHVRLDLHQCVGRLHPCRDRGMLHAGFDLVNAIFPGRTFGAGMPQAFICAPPPLKRPCMSMRHALIIIITLIFVGCASEADYRAPAGHPANSDHSDPTPLTAADPFAVEARPIEQAPSGSGDMHQHDHAHGPAEQDAPRDADASHDPSTVCPVTGAELGSMGEPVDVTIGGRRVRVCCPECVATVKADPDKYLPSGDAASAERDAQDGDAAHHEGGH